MTVNSIKPQTIIKKLRVNKLNKYKKIELSPVKFCLVFHFSLPGPDKTYFIYNNCGVFFI